MDISTIALQAPSQAESKTSMSVPNPGTERISASDVAQFEQIFQRAQDQELNIELSSVSLSGSSSAVSPILKGISASSGEYMTSVDNGLKSLQGVNLADPGSLAKVVGHFTEITVRGLQMSTVLSEVSSSKKSLEQLFHNQG
jgi:hypothetical protein